MFYPQVYIHQNIFNVLNFLSFPNKAEKICKSLANKIKKNFKKIDLILAPAMGGIIIGYEIGKFLKKETIFCERVKWKIYFEKRF